jgi:hypothetical protein
MITQTIVRYKYKMTTWCLQQMEMFLRTVPATVFLMGAHLLISQLYQSPNMQIHLRKRIRWLKAFHTKVEINIQSLFKLGVCFGSRRCWNRAKTYEGVEGNAERGAGSLVFHCLMGSTGTAEYWGKHKQLTISFSIVSMITHSLGGTLKPTQSHPCFINENSEFQRSWH